MSDKVDDGGPAFPAPFGAHVSGMTLRDFFAGQALVGFIASPDTHGKFSDIAKQAFGFADAMLAARAKVQP